MHRKIDEQAETIHQLTNESAEGEHAASVPSLVFPFDLPIPFTGMKMWHHLYTNRGTVVSSDELCRLFCTPSCRWPLRSMQATIAKIRRHLRKHDLSIKYGITTIATVGYLVKEIPAKGPAQ